MPDPKSTIDEGPGALSAITDATAAKEIGKLWRAVQARSGASHPDQNNLPDHVYATRGDIKTLRNEIAKRIDALPTATPLVGRVQGGGSGTASAANSNALSSLTVTAVSAAVNQTAALQVVAPAGGGYFRTGLAIGTPSPQLTCDVGIDLGNCRIAIAAIIVPEGSPVVFSPSAPALIRYRNGRFTFEAGNTIQAALSTDGTLGVDTLGARSVSATFLSGFETTVNTLAIMQPGGGATAGALVGYFELNLGGFIRRIPYYAAS